MGYFWAGYATQQLPDLELVTELSFFGFWMAVMTWKTHVIIIFYFPRTFVWNFYKKFRYFSDCGDDDKPISAKNLTRLYQHGCYSYIRDELTGNTQCVLIVIAGLFAVLVSEKKNFLFFNVYFYISALNSYSPVAVAAKQTRHFLWCGQKKIREVDSMFRV